MVRQGSVVVTISDIPRVLLISGPTASGKSALAVVLAQRLDGEVINLDSVQVYRGARIGAATISEDEMQGVPHHLIGFLDPSTPWDVRKMADLVGATAAAIRGRGRMPILVGGGGMYVSTLFAGISPLPERNETLRAELELRQSEDLYSELVERDPSRAAKLHPHDRLRIIRAIETAYTVSTAATELYKERIPPWVAGLMLVLTPPRELLYQAINTRVDQMIGDGIEDEVSELLRVVPQESVLWGAIGYAHVLRRQRGELLFEEFRELMQRDTRRFAKRQLTYWRNEPRKQGWRELCASVDWTWLTERGTIEGLCRESPVSVLRFAGMGAAGIAALGASA